ncbi:hypothetical protein NMG60_11004530 [Bertholletia excelsa]
MKTHDLIFINRPESKVNRKLLYNLKDVAAAPYGEFWRQMKSILVLKLLSNKKVQSFRVVREEETTIMVNKIKDSCSCSMPVNLSHMFVAIANDVVSRAVFGKKVTEGESGRRLKLLLRELLELLGSADVEDFLPRLSWINWFNGRDAKVKRVAKGIDEFLEGMVQDRLELFAGLEAEKCGVVKVNGENREDFVDILLKIYNQKETVDRDTVKALILEIFSAGTDTTSTVMEWAMTELLRHPRIMNKLQKQVREIAKGKPHITEDNLEEMHYLKAVIKETLRLHPPTPLLVPREASQDVKIMGYDIQAGTMVIINAWTIGRDPGLWTDPEEFRPERFLNSSIDFKGQDFGLIPFGAGRRGCPGIAFAMALNEIVLANVVLKFDWELPGGAKGEDLDMRECIGLTIKRKVPLLAAATSCYS